MNFTDQKEKLKTIFIIYEQSVKQSNKCKQLLRANDGYKSVLNYINNFSKYVSSEPVKTKSGCERAIAWKKIFSQMIKDNYDFS